MDYSSYFYRQLLGKFFILFCFVFPLESLNSVLIFDTDENMEYRQNKAILKWNMTQKSFEILSLSTVPPSGAHCLCFTHFIFIKNIVKYWENKGYVLIFLPIFTWAKFFLSAIQLAGKSPEDYCSVTWHQYGKNFLLP